MESKFTLKRFFWKAMMICGSVIFTGPKLASLMNTSLLLLFLTEVVHKWMLVFFIWSEFVVCLSYWWPLVQVRSWLTPVVFRFFDVVITYFGSRFYRWFVMLLARLNRCSRKASWSFWKSVTARTTIFCRFFSGIHLIDVEMCSIQRIFLMWQGS